MKQDKKEMKKFYVPRLKITIESLEQEIALTEKHLKECKQKLALSKKTLKKWEAI